MNDDTNHTPRDDCARVRELVSWAAAGTLAAQDNAFLAAHLDACADCAQEYTFWRTIGDAVRQDTQRITPPMDFDSSWALLAAQLPSHGATQPAPTIEVNVEVATSHVPINRRQSSRWATATRWTRQARLTLMTQPRLLHKSVWFVSAAACVAGTISALALPTLGDEHVALALTLPLMAGGGMAFLNGQANDATLEVAQATPTPASGVLLSRFALVFTFDALLAVLATLAVAMLRGEAFWELALLWLGPMALLSALSLLLSLLAGPALALSALTLWMVSVLPLRAVGENTLAQFSSAQIAQTTPITGAVAIVLLGVVAVYVSRREHLPSGNLAHQEANRMTNAYAVVASRDATTPGADAPMRHMNALGGVVRYEFLMQMRRVAFWVVFALLAVVPFIQFINTQTYTHNANLIVTRNSVVIVEAAGAAGILSLGVGLMLAGRFSRDHTLKVDEIIETTPTTLLIRLLGKYLGNILAALVPVTLVYVAGFAILATSWRDFSILPLALAGYLALVIPAILFVGAFSVALTTVMWPPLFMFLFIGYYLWDGLQPGGPIPTLDGTVLSPSGRLTMTGVFHFTPFRTTDLAYYPHASLWLGFGNIGALVGAGALALFAAWLWQLYLARHR